MEEEEGNKTHGHWWKQLEVEVVNSRPKSWQEQKIFTL